MKKQLLSVLSLVFILSISCSEKKTNIQVKENSEKTICISVNLPQFYKNGYI